MRVSFESPTENLLSKGRKFLALCSTRFQKSLNLRKIFQVVPLWFSLFFRSLNMLKGTNSFQFWHASRKTLAKKLKKFAHAKIFFPHSPKDFPSSSKSDKKEKYFLENFLNIFIWIGGKRLWHPSSEAFVEKFGIFSLNADKDQQFNFLSSKENPPQFFYANIEEKVTQCPKMMESV